MKAVSSATVKRRSDALRHILKIPLVDKTIDLPRLFVALIVGVGVIHDTDESNSPDREQTVYVTLDKLKLASKSRLSLTQNYIEFSCLGISYHPFEFGAVTVRARIIVVAVDVVYLPPHSLGMITEHRLLILNT